MADAGLSLFDQLKEYSDFEDLIEGGEAESLFLECKSPGEPRLTKDQKNQLGVAISGFSNTAGGVLVYGLSTTTHKHTGLDVISQIEEIGLISKLEQQVKNAIPATTVPPVFGTNTKIVKRQPRDSKGVLLLYVPAVAGDPVQATHDNVFYMRTGDEFRPAPYEIIKRLFSAVDVPDLYVWVNENLVEKKDDSSWNLPIVIRNNSTAIAENALVSVTVLNPNATESITATGLTDVSELNPGQTIFNGGLSEVVHRGMNVVVGNLIVKMKVGNRAKRRLDLSIIIYANKMRARQLQFDLTLAQSGFKVTNVKQSFLY